MKNQACPACSSTSSTNHEVDGVAVCSACGCHYTTRAIYLGESYRIVLPHWHDGDEAQEDWRPYDLTTLGSKGIERRHGWFHAGTKRILQVG